MLSLFRNRLFVAVTTGHFAIDVLNSVIPVLMAVLAVPLALSNRQIGTALTLQIFAGSLSQPLFGLVADRFPGRPTLLAGIGAAWMALCIAGAVLAHSWALLVPLLLLASLGSALFHPIGTASAVAAHPTRAGGATAIFFFGGQLGLALGPVLAGLLLGHNGSGVGLLPLCALALIPAALLLTAPAPMRVAVQRNSTTSRAPIVASAVAAFIVLVAVRSSIQQVYTSFLPKLFADRGWDPAAFGLMAGTFMLSAAVGNVITGDIADRYGMRAATIWPLLLSIPAGLLCLWSPTTAMAFIGCALAGLLVGGQHSVLVVHAQRLLPTGRGFAAGLILGFTFAAGGVGTWLVGIIADQVGLLHVMEGVTLLALPAALLALTLPGRERAPVEVAVAQA